MKKIFVITTHCSEECCKRGNDYLYDCLDSLYQINPDKIIVVDNQSSIKCNLTKFKNLNIQYIYIENQKERGLTGAWNIGINAATQYGPSLICNTNNDVIFNLSYINLYNHILQDNLSSYTIYGAKTNNPGWQKAQHFSDKNAYILSGKKPDVLNGFCLFFTTEFYQNYQEDGLLFSNEKKYPWGGQEEIMTHWTETKKLYIKVVNNCFVYHHKDASWRKTLIN